MPSKKLPNRVEGLFDATRSIVKDGRHAAFSAAPLPAEAPPALPADLEVPQAMAGWTWEVDASGAYIFCSAEVEHLLGFSPQELQGKTLASLSAGQPGEDGAFLSDHLSAAQPFTDVRWKALRKDGRRVVLTMSGYPVRDEDGRLKGYHGITYLAGPAEQPRETPPRQAAVPPEAPPAAAQAPMPVAQVEPPKEAPRPQVKRSTSPLPPLVEPARPMPAPPSPARGYLDSLQGLAPFEGDAAPPEIGEAIAAGRLIQKVSDPLAAAEGDTRGAGRSLAVPIKLQEQILGALDFFDPDKNQAWSEDDLALAQTVADQLALALENARLFNETSVQQRNATYLAHATQAVARSLSEPELWSVLADELVAIYRPQRVLISQWDSAARTLTPLAVRGGLNQGGTEIGVALPLASQPPEVAQALLDRQGQFRRLTSGQKDASLTAMLEPLVYDGEVECLVEVTFDRAEGATAEDLRLLGSILLASASALRTVRLYDLQRQTAERLTEMDKVKSQFLANMSHELRTPLNSIIGFSRVILKGIDGPLTEQQAQDLTSIYNSGRHLLELINGILDMSKIEAGKMEMVFEEVDLRDIIKGVMSTAVGLVKDKPAITLREEIASQLPTVNADATRVRQVLINLMSNAAKFTDLGNITLRAGPVEERDLRTGQIAHYVQVSVEDTGTGIAEKDMHKLFEAFSQVDASPTRKVGGTGLGLSISRRMIEMQGGRIWAESTLGQGSTFSFTLPVYQHAPPPVVSAQAGAPAIMIVEDDQGIAGLYRRYLEPHGYSVVHVDKSAEAAASAARHHPAAILLDVIMPARDGWQVLADLKQSEQTRNIPVIVCTIVSDRERALSLGAADYLNKPILEADLLQALEKVAPALRLQPAASGAASH